MYTIQARKTCTIYNIIKHKFTNTFFVGYRVSSLLK